jgi:hypothetical protein
MRRHTTGDDDMANHDQGRGHKGGHHGGKGGEDRGGGQLGDTEATSAAVLLLARGQAVDAAALETARAEIDAALAGAENEPAPGAEPPATATEPPATAGGGEGAQ